MHVCNIIPEIDTDSILFKIIEYVSENIGYNAIIIQNNFYNRFKNSSLCSIVLIILIIIIISLMWLYVLR